MTEHNIPSKGYSNEQIAQFKAEIQKLRDLTVGVRMVLYDLSQRLINPRARTFANEGIGRRLPLVARSASNVFELYPPNKTDLLTQADCDDVAIQLHAFAINVYAIFDNIAWVCMLEAGGALPPLKVSLFRKDCQPFLPADLKTYLDQDATREWFNKYGKVYRDSTAHRIPPYLPSRTYTQEESQRFAEVHRESERALVEACGIMNLDRRHGRELLNRHERLRREKETIGSNSLLIALSLVEEDASSPVFLHPQLLSDWALANEVVQIFDRAVRTDKGWPICPLPSVTTN